MVDLTNEIDFTYTDSDSAKAEIAELYSYTEESEFVLNLKSFDITSHEQLTDAWTQLDDESRKNHIRFLLNRSEVSNHEVRQTALRSLLYIIQGVFGECVDEESQSSWACRNAFLLYECGTFNILTEALSMEIQNEIAAANARRKPAVSIADSVDLRIILNIMYLLVEIIRRDYGENDTDKWKKSRERFKNELLNPILHGETLFVILFNMITKFCDGFSPHFPMKKVLLLLWKVILFTLGGLNDFYKQKNICRTKYGLPTLKEDPLKVINRMRSSSPPTSAQDLIDQNVDSKSHISNKKGLTKQSSMEEPYIENGNDQLPGDVDNINPDLEASISLGDDRPPTPPRPATPSVVNSAKSLPWTPKVRKKDLEVFLDHTRKKFIGFTVPDDFVSVAGLPHPINEGIKILQQHMYQSVGEVQEELEKNYIQNPLSKFETDIAETPAEILYRNIYSSLPQYMIALLKIILAASPTSKAKTDSINILADILPEEMSTNIVESIRLGIDVNRHKEITVKSVSAILLLMLKYFKLNHIYQFEFMGQHLVFANCIPLVLKFFNQTVTSYVTAKNSISVIDFPSCVLSDTPQLTAESLEAGDNQPFCWRNLFTCINLLRILNKLTKWKHSRTMMLVVFKSAPILRKTLRVRQAMMQLYVLKLLKMQAKYLGRPWRKSNMTTMSAIYQKVRHRLNDDWAFGNETEVRPWDFQVDEAELKHRAEKFNSRRYGPDAGLQHPDFKPVDNCILSVLGNELELSEDFKRNYERWLDMEVFSTCIDWDQVLTQ